MGYVILPRRYRPQTFSDLIGQEEVVQTLTNAIASQRLAQAYLFYGPRGVGKTTVARLLSKALNCEKGITPQPCGECTSCVEIAESRSLDVHEIDGASNTGVDNIRELKETIIYPPARDRYKIFIIDEVHMLSTSAFNALLKTLEEPPPHAVFIFATTHRQKIPATILSRCQQFTFHPIPPEPLADYIKTIMEKEEITASEGTVKRIVRASEGCVRDALSLLDQMVNLSGLQIKEDLVVTLLGEPPAALVADLLTNALSGERQVLHERLGAVKEEGTPLTQIYEGCLITLREAVSCALGSPTTHLLPVEAELVERLTEMFSYETLLRAYRFLLKEQWTVNRSEHPAFAVELLLITLTELPRLKALEESMGESGAPRKSSTPTPVPPAAAGRSSAAPKREASPPTTETPVEAIIREVEASSPSLAGYLENGTATLDDKTLVLTFPADAEASFKRVKEKQSLLKSAVVNTLGNDAACSLVLEKSERPVDPLRKDAERDPAVRRVLDRFQGTIVEVLPVNKEAETEEVRDEH